MESRDLRSARRRMVMEALERGWPPCAQAQADGVPCQELGRACEECERAFPYLVQEPRREA